MGEKQRLFTQHNINPLKLLITPITQAPVFMSLFIGLRGMAVAPVASMKTGGMLWFTDLTVPDAYLGLPCVCTLAILTTIQLSVPRGVPQDFKQMVLTNCMRSGSFVFIPLGLVAPSAIMVYLSTNSLFTVVQSKTLTL